jgi:oligoribonuclease NrnB/cAMP/cGMP phosphodiesterase (DHH superfamily)
MDIISFHNACPDGWASAYIAKLKYPLAKLLPLDHGAVLDMEQFRDKDVLMLDFSLRTREQNDRLAEITKSFHIYDHHKSAQEVLAGVPYATFDMSRSGAGLSWDYLLGEDFARYSMKCGTCSLGQAKPRPWWVDYVEDRDLWRFALPESRAVNAFIMTTEYALEPWRLMTEVKLDDAITKGRAIELEVNKYVREVTKQAQAGTLNVGEKRYTVGVVNCPYLHASDIGHVLSARYDIGLSYFERGDGMVQMSLRSQGDIDVSAVVKHFGGGGHMHAAGLQLPLDSGRKLIDTILGRAKTDTF